jgi:hypothetical protein
VALDFVALMPGPMRLADLVESERRVLAELLGLEAAPAPRLFAGSEYIQGQLVAPGWELGPEQIAAAWLGPGTPALDLDVVDEGGRHIVLLIPPEHAGGSLICVPHRSPVPVVIAMGFALAAALAGGGRYIDNDLQLTWEKGITDDDGPAFVAATKLPRREATFEQACREYLRQFDHLAHWHLGDLPPDENDKRTNANDNEAG